MMDHSIVQCRIPFWNTIRLKLSQTLQFKYIKLHQNIHSHDVGMEFDSYVHLESAKS
jgi:hypothetical protein